MITQKSVDFIKENAMRNDREWFHSHREDYENLVTRPMRNIVMCIAGDMEEIDSFIITEPKTGQMISRINRDTRFSANKALYRDYIWASFRRSKKTFPGYPEFYFGFGAEGMFYGMGYYLAEARLMECMREAALRRDERFMRALKEVESQDVFSIDGDMYKRSRYPDEPENIRSWLDRKSICFTKNSADPSPMFSPDFADVLAKDFKKLTQTYRFLIYCEGLKNDKL